MKYFDAVDDDRLKMVQKFQSKIKLKESIGEEVNEVN